MALNDAGYLICKNVPIARTGTQKYLRSELSLDNSNEVVTVRRDPEQVFAPASMASFEGVSLTFEHPPEFLSASTDSTYHKGHVQNIRRGTVDGQEFLMADLVVKDASTIAMIQGGLRQISCGYDHDLQEMPDGTFRQTNIVGNHVSLVRSGRAGAAVAIRDTANSLTKYTTGNKPTMSLKKMWGSFVKANAVDADPEELADVIRVAAKAMDAKTTDADKEDDKDDEKKESKDAFNTRLAKVEDALSFLVKRAKDADEEAEKKAKEAEAKDEDPDMDDTSSEDGSDFITGAGFSGEVKGSDTLVTYLKSIKPVIAKTKDKAIIDGYNQAIAKATGKSMSGSKDTYGKIAAGAAKQQNQQTYVSVDGSNKAYEENIRKAADLLRAKFNNEVK